MRKMLRIASTTAILVGSAIFPSKIIAPDSYMYTNTIYIPSFPSLESRLKTENATFVIDPGHDTTYTGCHVNKLEEEILNLAFSKKMAKSFQEEGGKVHLTRTSGEKVNINNLNLDEFKIVDVKDELVARANNINGFPSDVVLMVHNNAYFVSKTSTTTEWNTVNGMEIYFCGVKNQRQFNDNKLNYTQPKDCKIYSESSRLIAERLGKYMQERGFKVSVMGSDMKLLNLNSDRIELYLEMGYMTSHEDYKNITNPLWQDKIVNAITNYFNEDINYIKKVNKDYSLKRNLFYILNPKKDSTNLEKMMNKFCWKNEHM